jgi:hypothetical protein
MSQPPLPIKGLFLDDLFYNVYKRPKESDESEKRDSKKKKIKFGKYRRKTTRRTRRRKITRRKTTRRSTRRKTTFGKKKLKKGKNKRWIQAVTKSFEKKGTKGAFTRWCKSKGFSSVSLSCISLGKKSKSLRTRRRAIFAQNIRKRT